MCKLTLRQVSVFVSPPDRERMQMSLASSDYPNFQYTTCKLSRTSYFAQVANSNIFP